MDCLVLEALKLQTNTVHENLFTVNNKHSILQLI